MMNQNLEHAGSTGSEIGTCAFCRKALAAEAVQCSSCGNWRRDIHLLIDKHRKLEFAQLVTITLGGFLAAIVFAEGARHPSARRRSGFMGGGTALSDSLFEKFEKDGVGEKKYGVGGSRSEFSFEKFVATPFFAIGLLIVICVVVAWVATQIAAARTRRRIQEKSKGLWKRPWWSY